jgi:ribosome-associated toxin RatA of RatAB toxin-antitoxin module
MPQAKRTEVWDAPIDKIFEVLTDYESYPEFVDGCSSVDVISKTETEARVEFGLNLIKKFKYILVLKQTRPTEVSWSFESGDIFKKNEGAWVLKDLGDGKTEVNYSLEVEIKGFAPKSLVNSLTEKNLPAMLKSYHERCKTH